LRLLTTNVRPRRRTTADPGWRFSHFSEFLTFMWTTTLLAARTFRSDEGTPEMSR
jgi:hypothetical protein